MCAARTILVFDASVAYATLAAGVWGVKAWRRPSVEIVNVANSKNIFTHSFFQSMFGIRIGTWINFYIGQQPTPD